MAAPCPRRPSVSFSQISLHPLSAHADVLKLLAAVPALLAECSIIYVLLDLAHSVCVLVLGTQAYHTIHSYAPSGLESVLPALLRRSLDLYRYSRPVHIFGRSEGACRLRVCSSVPSRLCDTSSPREDWCFKPCGEVGAISTDADDVLRGRRLLVGYLSNLRAS